VFNQDFQSPIQLIPASRKYLRYFHAARNSSTRKLLGFGLALCLSTMSFGDSQRSNTVVFVHATDPHLFIPAAQDSDKDRKAMGDRQEALNQKALTDMLQRIQGLSGSGPAPAFLVLTGDFGVDPCDIPKSQPAPAAVPTGQNKEPAKAAPLTSKQCVDSDPAKRSDRIARLSKALGASPLKEIYLVAGNNDVAHDDPDSVSLGYFNQFIDDLQKKLNDDKAGVQLHNLTACYAGTGGSSSCFADIADGYRLIGFPSYSFKNWDGKNTITTNDAEQAKQFETFRSLLDQAKQAGKQVLVLSHIPEIDDPYVLAQDRDDAKSPAPNDDPDPKNPRSIRSAWNVSVKLLDGWKEMLQSDTVAAVLAGHLHDSHKEIYRRPYAWSTVDDHRLGFRKLFLAPPLAVKNQDTSPIQARGFSLVTLQPNHINALLYWYNQETGEFKSDATGFEHRQTGRFKLLRIPRFITWMWQLDKDDKPLLRLAIFLIALLTAYLTIVAIWNIPPIDNPLKSTDKSNDRVTDKGAVTAGKSPTPSVVTSPFASDFGKTVIAGLTGLAVTEVAKALGGSPDQAASSASRYFYIVWFIFFFFVLLFLLALFRGFVEGFRATVAIPRYALARPSQGRCRTPSQKFWDAFSYWCWRFFNWFLLLRVPLLTGLDTVINLIQGKNQTMTRVFADTIIEQQRNLVQVVHAIRKDLTKLIEHKLTPAPTSLSSPVRVAISVLSADQRTVFYISQSPGSAKMAFIKRSVAWVSVFTGKIRWYEQKFGDMPNYKDIVLFDNSRGVIADDEDSILLASHYQPRDQDYEAFIVLPVPWPQRGYGSDYVKGAIHISFTTQTDFEKIWGYHPPAPKPPASAPASNTPAPGAAAGPLIYSSEQKMIQPLIKKSPSGSPSEPPPPAADQPPATTDAGDSGGWCIYVEICVALTNSMTILGELLRNFNEVIYKSYIEPNPRD
jgi:hypothetical protein